MTETALPYLDLTSPDERATDAEIATLKAAFSTSLPDLFVTLYQQHGPIFFGDNDDGGLQFDIAWRSIDGQDIAVDAFDDLLLDDVIDTMKSVPDILEVLSEWTELASSSPPAGAYLPFSETHDAHVLMIAMTGPETGKIFAWRTGPDAWGEGQSAYIGFIADSFGDFLNNRLYPISDD